MFVFVFDVFGCVGRSSVVRAAAARARSAARTSARSKNPSLPRVTNGIPPSASAASSGGLIAWMRYNTAISCHGVPAACRPVSHAATSPDSSASLAAMVRIGSGPGARWARRSTRGPWPDITLLARPTTCGVER